MPGLVPAPPSHYEDPTLLLCLALTLTPWLHPPPPLHPPGYTRPHPSTPLATPAPTPPPIALEDKRTSASNFTIPLGSCLDLNEAFQITEKE
uniref:Uncharacterized protein n=1 Tax=Knipowitschia caucasica TaxID=637954 RepID=A0AAV2M690_KNICA